MSAQRLRIFIESKLDWIKEKQNKIRSQKREAPKEYQSGENHYFFGKQYSLLLVEEKRKAQVKIENDLLILQVRPHSTKQQKQRILQEWYRAQLKEVVVPMIQKYESEMKVKVSEFGIKKMKSRWGTCNVRAQRIWLNLELARAPLECLEHIVVHEMVHLLERKHNAKFFAYMDKFLPQWRDSKEKLKLFPIR